MLLAEAKKTGATISIVSRLGRGENERMNRIRLFNVRQLLLIGKAIEPRKVISKNGKRFPNKRTGQLEFYLGRKLLLISEAPFNKSICADCCEP